MDYGRIFFNCNKFSFGVRHVIERMRRTPHDGEFLQRKYFARLASLVAADWDRAMPPIAAWWQSCHALRGS